MNKNLERFYKWLETNAHFLLFDLEANFYEGKYIKEMETIQIGYIKFDSNFSIIKKGSIFIKPLKYPFLSDFIKELTWIIQDQINAWKTFADGLWEFVWLYNKETDYLMSYWYYDMKQIYWDCKINNINYPFDEWNGWEYSKHINIKNTIAKRLNIKEKWMWPLMAQIWIPLVWKHHNWEDDCFNILQLIKHVFKA